MFVLPPSDTHLDASGNFFRCCSWLFYLIDKRVLIRTDAWEKIRESLITFLVLGKNSSKCLSTLQ